MPSRNVKGALAPVKRGHSVAINIAPDEGIPSPNNKVYLGSVRHINCFCALRDFSDKQSVALQSV